MTARSTVTSLLVCCLFVVVLVSWTASCGPGSTPYAESTITTAANTSTTGPSATGTLGTAAPTTDGSPATGGPSPQTTILPGTGTTGSEGQLFALTFVGPVGRDTWQALREIVIAAHDDGQAVIAGVAKLATGAPVEIGIFELDSVSGIGFMAGASASQPIAVATDSGGNQVMVFAYTVIGDPAATTIVGYERGSRRVVLVVGPLKIDDSTPNMTTIPQM